MLFVFLCLGKHLNQFYVQASIPMQESVANAAQNSHGNSLSVPRVSWRPLLNTGKHLVKPASGFSVFLLSHLCNQVFPWVYVAPSKKYIHPATNLWQACWRVACSNFCEQEKSCLLFVMHSIDLFLNINPWFFSTFKNAHFPWKSKGTGQFAHDNQWKERRQTDWAHSVEWTVSIRWASVVNIYSLSHNIWCTVYAGHCRYRMWYI